MKKLISVITPCYNEEANVQECYQRLRKVFETDLSNYAYEHIFADNASTDCTLLELRKLAAIDKNVKVIVNSRNVGPFRNMWNAMKHASGDAIIPLLPADLQDPPEVIPALVKNWEIGDLVVYGIRKNRQEGVMMRLLRSIYYRIIAKFADVEIPKDSGEFLLADSRVIHSVINLDDSYPYIRGLIAKTAVRHSFVSYTWEKENSGNLGTVG